MKKHYLLTILLWCFLVGHLLAQGRTISGKITAADDGSPLPGVNVLLKGSSSGAISDAEGNYKISVSNENAILVFSFIGYKSREVVVGSQTTINVTLEADTRQLSEVVVTSFGIEQERKSLGYSVQEVSSKDILKSQEPNLVNAMRGQLSGVMIQNSSGSPGAGANIIIRGITSMSPNANNQPLFVIDGIPVSNETNSGNTQPSTGSNAIAGSSEQFSASNRIADLNPNDIESISVLKGPSASALYGLRAANGVIIITTKKGTSGRAVVNYNLSVGIDEVNKFPLRQAIYREGIQGRIRLNADQSVSTTRFQDFGPKYPDGATVYDNFENIWRTGSNVSNNLSVSGGNERTTYYTSVSHLNQIGVAPSSDWKRLNFSLKGSTKITEKLRVDGSATYTQSGGVRANGGDKSILSALNYHSSTFDVNDYKFPNGTQKNYSLGIIDNPRYLSEVSTLTDKVNRLVGFVGLNYSPTNWLNIRYQLGTDVYSDERRRVAPPGLDISSQVNGFIVEERYNYKEINSNLLVTLNKQFNDDLRGTLVLGNQVTDIDNSGVTVRGENYSLSNFNDISNTSIFFPSRTASLRRLVGVFGSATLEYKGMLFLGLTGRNDWSSTLPAENRSFFYPSVSLSWVFSETFKLDDNPIINAGKLRISTASVGKDAAPYRVGNYFTGAADFPFGSINGFRLSTISGSLTLQPERTQSYEIGTELGFLRNRLTLDATYFVQESRNQITTIPISNATGFASFVANAGVIENRGFELLLNGRIIDNTNFRWSASLNWSRLRGTVKTMPDGIREIIFQNDVIVNKIVEGGRVGDLWGFPYKRRNGQLLIDNNGYPFTTLDTLKVAGNAMPDWFGGITNTFTYKGITLSFLVEVRQGGDAYDVGMRNRFRNGVDIRTENRNQELVFNGVTETGQPNTRAVFLDRDNFYNVAQRYASVSDVLLQKTSWVRLRNVSIGYSLPERMLSKTFIKNLRFTATGNNLLLSTPFMGFDPESIQNGAGSNAFGYVGQTIPAVRNFTFSLNATF
ncbi:MAG: SusC/RagA family TonB-linked outer membrane protein [Thermoflexibacter sp.]|jgi:TonB-linked SusC/RagA family outer membrane protein|nr:SusC/RagA family TonB-linked outer membrane protein [Thermoflexibacter sp.]